MKKALIALLLGTTAACTHSFQIQTPSGFAALDEGHAGYAYRATSADGVVIAVREEPNRPASNLAFWSAAVGGRVAQAGYTEREALEVHTRGGLVGRELRFDKDDAGVTYRYWVAVFVAHDEVYCVEAGGDRDHFDAARDAVQSAIETLRAG